MKRSTPRLKRLVLSMFGLLSLVSLLLNTKVHQYFISYQYQRSNVSLTLEPPRRTRTRRFLVKDTSIVNDFRFSYPINVENACRGNQTVEIVIPVHSAVTNFKRRSMTRQGKQGKFVKNQSNNARMLFFVGLPSRKLANFSKYQASVEAESKRFGDVVQINSTDAYKNLVTKAMGVFNWIFTYCPNSEIILKIDDDVDIYPSILILSIYKKLTKLPDFIVGELRVDKKPMRYPDKKWFLPKADYPNDTFPPFVPGPAIGYPMSTARLVYQQALRTKVVWLDDLFLTGICRQRLGIPIFNDVNFHTKTIHRKVQASKFVYS